MKPISQRRPAGALRRAFASCLVLLSLLLLAACGPGGKAVPNYSGLELRVLLDPSSASVFKTMLDKFAADTGASYTISQVGLVNVNQTLSPMKPEDFPDVMLVVHDNIGYMVSQKWLAPLDLERHKAGLLPGALNAFLYDGAYYGLPLGTENLALVRNPLLVPIQPKTFDELAETALRLQAEGTVSQAFMRQDGDTYHFYPIMSAFGGAIFEAGPNGFDPSKLLVSSEGSIKAGKWIEEMVKAGVIKAGNDYNTMHNAFTSGHTAMIITGPWAMQAIRASGIPYIVSEIPKGTTDPTPFLGVVGAVVYAGSPRIEAARYFVDNYLASEAFAHLFYNVSARTPAMLKVRATLVDPDARAFAQAGEKGIPMPNIPAMSEVWTDMNGAIERITRGDVSSEEAFKHAEDNIRSKIR